MKKKIVFLCTKLDGGIGRNIVRLSRFFSLSGYDVQIWSEIEESDYPEELPVDVEIRKLNTSHGVVGIFWVLVLSLTFKPDIVLTPSERFTRIVYRARKFLLIKAVIIACVHNYYSELYRDISKSKQLKRKKLIRSIYQKIDSVICVSKGVESDLREYANLQSNNITVIYNPIVDMGVAGNESGHLPEGLYELKPVVVNVGKVVYQKNHIFLIDCFDRLRERIDCNLIIVGGGEEKYIHELEDRIKASPYRDNIYYVGQQQNPFVYMKQAKVFAFTSRFEGFGNVVVESLSVGTPVVSTESGGPSEILIDPKCGQIVDTNSAEEFAEALENWLNKEVDKLHLIEFASDNYSTSKIASEYLQLIDSLGS